MNVFKKMRHLLRSRIDTHPTVYLTLCHIRLKTRQLTISKDMEIVIKSFPCSANIFAVAAFIFIQEQLMKIICHLHVPVQVVKVVRREIFCMVLIRKPRDAVLSLLVREPHISAEQALKDYIRFYRTVVPYRDKFVVGRFEEVTTKFGKVIRRVNARFGTNFKPFEHTEENLQKVFQIVEEMHKEAQGLREVKEEAVGCPSAKREMLKKKAETKLETAKAKNAVIGS